MRGIHTTLEGTMPTPRRLLKATTVRHRHFSSGSCSIHWVIASLAGLLQYFAKGLATALRWAAFAITPPKLSEEISRFLLNIIVKF